MLNEVAVTAAKTPKPTQYYLHILIFVPDWSKMAKSDKQLGYLSALDFCRIVGARQHDDRGVGILAVPLADAEQDRLAQLLRDSDTNGDTVALEHQARGFLVVYRERERVSQVLSDRERSQLERILASQPTPPDYVTPRAPRSSAPAMPHISRRTGWIAGGVAAVASLVFAGITVFSGTAASPAPTGSVPDHPPAVQVAIGVTDLQSFKQNYGPFKSLSPSDQKPQTGQPALLLLENSAYSASTKWTLTPTATGWQQDIMGNVGNVDVKGNYADITDSDNVPYVVGINQPFVVSRDPGTVLRIDPTGNVYEMTLAQATAVRQPLGK